MKKIILNIAFAMGTVLLLSQCKKEETNLPVGTLKVTYDSVGGSAVAAQDVPAGTPFTLAAAPTKANLVFGAWCVSPQTVTVDSKTGAITYASGKAFDAKSVINNNITLYARWDAQITLDANGGKFKNGDKEEDTYKSQFPVSETAVKKPTLTPIQDGKMVTGWSLTPGGAPYAFGQTLTQNIVLYAIWESRSVEAGDFIFDKATGTITGLTAAGMANPSLSAPTQIDGVDVKNISLTAELTNTTVIDLDLSATKIETLNAASFGPKFTALAEIILPSTLKKIEENTFSFAKNITGLGLLSTTPPSFSLKSGLDLSKVDIFVPADYKGYYLNDSVWKTSKSITAFLP